MSSSDNKNTATPILIEVIATTLGDVLAAQAGGADRIELITGFAEGGLTPSLALIEQAVHEAKIPFRVMIRPHARSFVYDQDDMRTIIRDVELAREAGAEAIVFGALTADGQVDEEALRQVLAAAGPMKMTFHRAIDEAVDIMEALETILAYEGITDILTSGGAQQAVQAVDTIRRMTEIARAQGVHILAGSGLSMDNAAAFIEQTGVNRVHFGSAVREEGNALKPIDRACIQALRVQLGQHV